MSPWSQRGHCIYVKINALEIPRGSAVKTKELGGSDLDTIYR